MNKFIIVFLLILPPMLTFVFGSSAGFASTADHGAHEASIPNMVWLQFINFGLYAAVLFFALKKPVLTFFSSRETNYRDAIKKAEAAKTEAETKRREIQERLTKLESTRDQSIEQARTGQLY